MNNEELQQLQDRVRTLEKVLFDLAHKDRLIISNLLQLMDGRNIQTGLTTGTKIGTATSQKLGFWGVTPVVQPSTVGTTGLISAGAGTAVKDDSTFNGSAGVFAYTIADIVKHLKAVGILKT